MTTQATGTTFDKFLKVVGNADSWNTIDDLVAVCDEAGYWTKEFNKKATAAAKKTHLRHIIKRAKDGEGFPLFASVETMSADGTKVRVYKQEMLFDISDYKQVAQYHVAASKHHRTMAVKYAERCKKRFRVQLKLGFAVEEVERTKKRGKTK